MSVFLVSQAIKSAQHLRAIYSGSHINSCFVSLLPTIDAWTTFPHRQPHVGNPINNPLRRSYILDKVGIADPFLDIVNSLCLPSMRFFGKNKAAKEASFDEAKSSPSESINEKTDVHDVAVRRPSSQPSNRAEEILEEVRDETTGHDGDDDQIEYPKAWRLGLITLALCLSVFLVALDNSIVSLQRTSIPPVLQPNQ